jgi:hypothetical protein
MLARVVSIQRQEHGESSLVRVQFSDRAEILLHCRPDSKFTNELQPPNDEATVSVALRRTYCDETKSESK